MLERNRPMTVSTNTCKRSPWRFAWTRLVAATFAMGILSAGCVASESHPETPPQPSEVSSERALSPITVIALQNCVTARTSRLSRHAYELSFEVEATRKGEIGSVEPEGSRLDDAELEACMISALKTMEVRDLVSQDESLPATSQSIWPAGRSVIGTTAVLPQAIRLIPIVITVPGGITIVVAVAIIVVVAVALTDRDPTEEECAEEKKWAEKECTMLLAMPNPPRNRIGPRMDMDDCIASHIHEACGGKPVDREASPQPGRRF